MLTRGDLLAGLAKAGQEAAVGDFMQRQVCTARANDMAERVFGASRRGSAGRCR